MSSPKPFVIDNFMKIVLKLKEQGPEVLDNKHAYMNKYRHQIK